MAAASKAGSASAAVQAVGGGAEIADGVLGLGGSSGRSGRGGAARRRGGREARRRRSSRRGGTAWAARRRRRRGWRGRRVRRRCLGRQFGVELADQADDVAGRGGGDAAAAGKPGASQTTRLPFVVAAARSRRRCPGRRRRRGGSSAASQQHWRGQPQGDQGQQHEAERRAAGARRCVRLRRGLGCGVEPAQGGEVDGPALGPARDMDDDRDRQGQQRGEAGGEEQGRGHQRPRRAEQGADRDVRALVDEVFDVADAARFEPGGERRAGGGEAGEEGLAQGAAVADQLGARLRVVEAVALVEGEVAFVAGQDLRSGRCRGPRRRGVRRWRCSPRRSRRSG